VDPFTGEGSLLVDTNLLLLWLIGHVDKSQIEKFKRTSAYTEDDFELLAVLIACYQSIVVTPHVLTEVSNLIGNLNGRLRNDALLALGAMVPTFVEEFASSNMTVKRPLFLRLGLTDAAIEGVTARPLTVLTDDLDLYVALSRTSIRAFNFNHIRTGAWSS
jgi:hypothetical protein